MIGRAKQATSLYLRNFVFGAEDSLVSTVGLLSGIAAAGVSSTTIILTGAVLLVVEAFSMAVGSFLSEHSVEEYVKQGEVSGRQPLVGALIMFFSYLVFGLIPLSPYFLVSPTAGLGLSIALTLAALFLLGLWSAHVARITLLRHGLEVLAVGGLAIIVGVLVGQFVQGWL